MSDRPEDHVDFDETVALALAHAADAGEPGPEVKARLLARLKDAAPPVPHGFVFFGAGDAWEPYPMPGLRMKVLALDRVAHRATIVIDAAPGSRFPPHHHGGDEECYVISGDVHTIGRVLGPGDFLHADAGTDHGELYTEQGAQVLLVVHAADYIPGYTDR